MKQIEHGIPLAVHLVPAKRAALVARDAGTILPAARSLYRWEDKLADETEVVVMLKTRSGAIHGLEKAFKELHPYKVPELLAVPVTGGLERYLGWINSETSLQIV